MQHEEDMAETGEDWSQSDEDQDEDEDQGAAMEGGGGRKLVGERLKQWVTRTQTITQSAIGWLEKMDTR